MGPLTLSPVKQTNAVGFSETLDGILLLGPIMLSPGSLPNQTSSGRRPIFLKPLGPPFLVPGPFGSLSLVPRLLGPPISCHLTKVI